MEKGFNRVAFDQGLKLGEICRGIRGNAFLYTERAAKNKGLGFWMMVVGGALGDFIYSTFKSSEL